MMAPFNLGMLALAAVSEANAEVVELNDEAGAASRDLQGHELLPTCPAFDNANIYHGGQWGGQPAGDITPHDYYAVSFNSDPRQPTGEFKTNAVFNTSHWEYARYLDGFGVGTRADDDLHCDDHIDAGERVPGQKWVYCNPGTFLNNFNEDLRTMRCCGPKLTLGHWGRCESIRRLTHTPRAMETGEPGAPFAPVGDFEGAAGIATVSDPNLLTVLGCPFTSGIAGFAWNEHNTFDGVLCCQLPAPPNMTLNEAGDDLITSTPAPKCSPTELQLEPLDHYRSPFVLTKHIAPFFGPN